MLATADIIYLTCCNAIEPFLFRFSFVSFKDLPVIFFKSLDSFLLNFVKAYGTLRSRGSSVSIVSDYGLDDRAIGVRSPA
jgi:hypothetical protein